MISGFTFGEGFNCLLRHTGVSRHVSEGWFSGTPAYFIMIMALAPKCPHGVRDDRAPNGAGSQDYLGRMGRYTHLGWRLFGCRQIGMIPLSHRPPPPVAGWMTTTIGRRRTAMALNDRAGAINSSQFYGLYYQHSTPYNATFASYIILVESLCIAPMSFDHDPDINNQGYL